MVWAVFLLVFMVFGCCGCLVGVFISAICETTEDFTFFKEVRIGIISPK